MSTPKQLADGVRTVDASQKFYGLEMGARMTLLDTAAGTLVHSPVALSAEAAAALGDARWVVAPNLFHHLHAGPWIERGAEGWCAPGLAEKRSDLDFAVSSARRVRAFCAVSNSFWAVRSSFCVPARRDSNSSLSRANSCWVCWAAAMRVISGMIQIQM